MITWAQRAFASGSLPNKWACLTRLRMMGYYYLLHFLFERLYAPTRLIFAAMPEARRHKKMLARLIYAHYFRAAANAVIQSADKHLARREMC